MRALRILVVLPVAMALLGATCVTSTNQRSDVGPWVGEVRNTGDTKISGSIVRAVIVDSVGQQFPTHAPTCPSRLEAGETATFEVPPLPESFGMVPPLHATFAPEDLGDDPGRRRTNVSIDVVERNQARRYVFVRVTNNQPTTLIGLSICANLRSPSGELLEVGNAEVFPGILDPRESETALIYFFSMPQDATVEFVAQSLNRCCDLAKIAPADIKVESSRTVTADDGRRYLFMAASATNNTGHDLQGATLAAYIEGSPAARVERVSAGCNGFIPKGETAATTFLIPLPEVTGERPVPVIDGVQGYLYGPVPLHPLDVSDVGLSGNNVVATVTNRSDEPVWVSSACFTLKGAHGRLVGTAATRPEVPLDPGESTRIEAIVPSTSEPTSAVVVAFGDTSVRLPPVF